MNADNNSQNDESGLKSYVAVRMLIGIALIIAVIAVLNGVLGFFENQISSRLAVENLDASQDILEILPPEKKTETMQGLDEKKAGYDQQTRHDSVPTMDQDMLPYVSGQNISGERVQMPPLMSAKTDSGAEEMAALQTTEKPQPTHIQPPFQKMPVIQHEATSIKTGDEQKMPPGASEHEVQKFPVVGMAFVNAVIRPLDYELNRRFYGWRPNDILNFTDNVNNFQLGVLEVTRRTSVILAERISRTGSTASFDKNLENAMNWFMIKPDRYWFPSAEAKYKSGLNEFKKYFEKLEKGEAVFYTRTDNLIPLLMAYEDLLGSCDENLVKHNEDDGSPVSLFKADDYFFYAKGVASAMVTILEAIQEDFNIMVSREGGMEVLHHAIESCRIAVNIDPLIIFNSGLDSIFANHRTNMAAPISHARFYLGVLIKALST